MSDIGDGRYPEKRFQSKVVEWLTEHNGYEELFGDIEATGARVDSAGLRAGRALLIEFKVHVTLPMVRHAEDRSGSLESKLAGALTGLYRRHADPLSFGMNHVWDRSQPPLFVVAAETFSEPAERELAALLAERADQWFFDWEVWKGFPPSVLERGETSRRRQPAAYETVDVPALIGRAARPPNRTVEELSDIAGARGAAHLFDHLISRARDEGYRVGTSRTVATCSRGNDAIACYPLEGSSGELIVGLDRTLGDLFPRAGAIGYRTSTYVVRSPEEVDVLLATASSPLIRNSDSDAR